MDIAEIYRTKIAESTWEFDQALRHSAAEMDHSLITAQYLMEKRMGFGSDELKENCDVWQKLAVTLLISAQKRPKPKSSGVV